MSKFPKDVKDSRGENLSLGWRYNVLISVGFILPLVLSIIALQLFETKFLGHYKVIRSELFNAAFVVAGLLLAMKTYIIVKMEEGVYNDDDYMRDFAIRNLDNSNLSHLIPLKKLSRVINATIVALSLAALAQLVDGTIPGNFEPVFAISIAGGAFSLSLVCWREMQMNLNSYFERLENTSKPKIDKIKKEISEQRREHGIDP